MIALITWSLAWASALPHAPVATSGPPLASAYRAAVVTLTPGVIDFGTLPRHAVREREILLRHHGREALGLAGVSSDCTCLTSWLKETALGPGARTAWTVRLETCDFAGEVRRAVWIDAANGARYTVPVRYRVVPELYLEADVLHLGLLGDGEAEAEVEIATAGDERFELLAVRCDDGQLEAHLERAEVTRPQPGRLRVIVHGPHAPGRLNRLVWVETTSKDVPRLRVPVVGTFVAGLSADMRVVDFGAVALGSSGERTVTLRCAPDLQLGDVRSRSAAVDIVDVQRVADEVRLRLVTRSDLPLGMFFGEKL